MPDPALPEPRPDGRGIPGAVRLFRQYVDALGRPLVGKVTVTGAQRTVDGEAVMVAAPVVVPVVGGVLEINLPPGEYTLDAALRTIDGHSVRDQDGAVLAADA